MEENKLTLNKETIDVLVANVIPTTKYFETRFEYMQYQIDEIKNTQVEFKKEVNDRFDELKKDIDKRFDEVKKDMDRRFDEVKNDIDNRFKQVDKKFDEVKNDIDNRFKQVDKRFEQVDKRFEQVNDNIMKLTLAIEDLKKSQETTIRDYIIERDRFYDKKFNNLRIFNIAMISLVGGIILKLVGIIH